MNSSQFKTHILAHSDRMFRLAKSMLRNVYAAEDAVQELSLKLWEKRENLVNIENHSAYTLRAMRNHCLDLIRTTHENVQLDADVESLELCAHQQMEQKELVGRIREMIDNLPELQRTIIRMRDVEEMELREIAYITSLTENAVSVNLSRARQKIREKILTEQKQVENKIWKI